MKYLILTLFTASISNAQYYNFNENQTDALVQALRNQAAMMGTPQPVQPQKVQLVDQYGRPINFER